MRTLKLLLVLSVIGFTYSLALAAGGAAVAADPYAPYYPLIAALIGTLGAFVRGLTPQTGFWHTWYGHAILTLIGCVLGSLLPVFEAGSVTKAALISALVGGVTTFLSAWKTKGKPDTTNVAAMLIPIFFIFMLPGCKTAGGKALETCELGQLQAQNQTVAVDVTAIAVAGGANWEQQLGALGATLAPGQLNCVIAAIVAAWSSSHGALTMERKAALDRLQQYLNAHPATSCGRIYFGALDSPQGDGPWTGAFGRQQLQVAYRNL